MQNRNPLREAEDGSMSSVIQNNKETGESVLLHIVDILGGKDAKAYVQDFLEKYLPHPSSDAEDTGSSDHNQSKSNLTETEPESD
jgi:hypothetical protein